MNIPRKFLKWLAGLGTAFAVLGVAGIALAQSGFGNSSAGLLKLVSGALQPLVSTWTIGSSSSRVAGIYATILDGTSVTIGGAVTGDFNVTGSVSTTRVYTATGTVALPAHSFVNDTNTGVWSSAADTFDIAVGGVNHLSVSSATTTMTGDAIVTGLVSSTRAAFGNGVDNATYQVVLAAPTAGAAMEIFNATDPGLAFHTTGLGRLTTDGFYVGISSNAGVILNRESSALKFGIANSFQWQFDTAANFHPLTSNFYDIGQSGLAVKNFYASGTAYFAGALASAGAAATPAYSFAADQDTGMWNAAAGAVGFAINSVDSVRLANAGAGGVISIVGGSGGAGSPSFTWTGDSDTGIWNTVNASINFEVNGSSRAQVTLLGVSSTGMTVNGNVTTTGALFYAPNLSALGATGDVVCQNNTTNFLEVQAINCTVSSIWFKKNVKSLSASELMDKARELRSVQYDLKDTGKHEEGFIAEEVAMIDPALVVFEETKDIERIAYIKKLYPSVVMVKDGKTFLPKTVDYARISVILAGAIQNLDERVAKLEK